MSVQGKLKYAVLRSIESFANPRPSIASRMKDGKALRKKFSIKQQGVYTHLENRINPIRILEEQAKTRIESLIPIRYERMLQSPFAFYRGGAAIMAQDLANQPITDITVQLCGDMHVSNFDLFGKAEHRLVFGINDFDETLPGSWEWDLKRLVASAVIASESLGGDKSLGKKLVYRIASEYQKRMQQYANMPYLALSQEFIGEKDILEHFSEEHQKNIDSRLKESKGQSNIQVLKKLTTLVGKDRKIIDKPPLIDHFKANDFGVPLKTLIDKALLNYTSTLLADRRILFERYVLKYFARKVVGVGSIGTNQYDIKRAEGFYLRQLRDMKGGIEIGPGGVSLKNFTDYARLFGWALALGHARSGDAAMIAGYCGESDDFQGAMYSFAKAYAKQNDWDYELFKKAVKKEK